MSVHRGKSGLSFNIEQFGFSKGEILPPVLQPPSKYPLLEYGRAPLIILSNEINYLVELKKDFAEHMWESINNIQFDLPRRDIERYSDRYNQDIITDKSETLENKFKYDYNRFPPELKPLQKRKMQRTSETNKRQKVVDVEKNLFELEEKEKKQQDIAEDKVKQENKEEEVEDEEEIMDEEMDDGTDYVKDYIDSEMYEEEDDLDDGPVYN